MTLSLGVISSIIFCGISIFSIIEILIKIFHSNKSLMINTHVDKLQEELTNKISSGLAISDNDLKDFRCLFDECIIKEEYYIIQNIVEKNGTLFRDFLKNSIGNGSEKSRESFDSILKFNCMQLDFCKSIKSDTIIKKIARQQYENLKFCADNNLSDWYKQYFDEIKIYLMCKNDNSSQNEITKNMFMYMFKINVFLIKKNNNDLFMYTIEEIQNFVVMYIFEYRDAILDNFVNYNFYMLSHCRENSNDEWFEKIRKVLCDFTKNVFVKDFPFNTFKSYYALIFNYYCDNNKEKALEFCKDTISIFTSDINSTELMSFKYFCIDRLYDISNEDFVFQEKIFELHIDILDLSMSVSTKQDKIMLPELEKLIFNVRRLKDSYSIYLDKYKSLLNSCIIADRPHHFYKFLNVINLVLSKTNLSGKELQKDLINIYFWAIIRSSNIANKNFYKISFELFEDAIKALDNNNQISENLGKHIISMLRDLAENSYVKNKEIVKEAINLLREISTEDKTLYFLLNYSECTQYLYRSIFSIGTNCIENNYEEGVRMISNTIGWSIIWNIKRNTKNVKYLIDKAIDLYEISEKMEISKATKFFIATLFTTIGAYCCKDAKLYTYRSKIINDLKVPVDMITTAARLRTSESETWNDLFDNKTEEYTAIFISEYKKKHQ